MSNTFFIQNTLQLEDTLPPLFSALEIEDQRRIVPELNTVQQLLAYVNDVNMLQKQIKIIRS
jgi:hypothetical protein